MNQNVYIGRVPVLLVKYRTEVHLCSFFLLQHHFSGKGHLFIDMMCKYVHEYKNKYVHTNNRLAKEHFEIKLYM